MWKGAENLCSSNKRSISSLGDRLTRKVDVRKFNEEDLVLKCVGASVFGGRVWCMMLYGIAMVAVVLGSFSWLEVETFVIAPSYLLVFNQMIHK